MKKNEFIIDINNDSRVTFIDQKNNQFWSKWKLIKDCSNDEKKQINLATPHPKYIVLDKDFGHEKVDIKIINNSYNELKNKLKRRGIFNYISDRSRNGYHVFIPTTNLDKIDNIEIKKELRAIYIKEFDCDISKKSSYTAISIPNRPHFKTGINYGIIEKIEGEIYKIPDDLIKISTEKIHNKNILLEKMDENSDFTEYFEKDKFWKYVSNNIIPDGTNRDFTIFPNIAIAASKTGKNIVEIKKIVNPIIQKNFPGKNWNEFNGWLKKAISGDINTYNFYQLNDWMKTYTEKTENIYEMSLSIQPDLNELLKNNKEDDKNDLKRNEKFKFYKDSELYQIKNNKTEWLVDKWIAKGDICFIAGKAASFKSTLTTHMAYSIASGNLVFNKYPTIRENVLYLNEENSTNIMISIINRVKKGDDLSNTKLNNIYFSMLENIRFDQEEDLVFLSEYMKRNNITTLIMDSFRRFIGFDENNATEMNKFFNNLKYLRKACNLTIIILHHLKKSGKFSSDIRDSLRGSSDIVNSADNIIGIERKKGTKMIKIEHIKNRNAEEIENKLLIIDSGDNNDMCYIYESDKVLDKTGAINVTDKLAEKIYEWIETNNIKDFKRKDIPKNMYDKNSRNSIVIALRDMVQDGILIKAGGGPTSKYIVNSLILNKKDEKIVKKTKHLNTLDI
ncbi:MAG: AAA family ATPase [Promethearchaeia archaeon]